MNVEENRLSTFTDWPANAAVDAARIAKAGFYYSGHALEVQCFLCGVKISDWNYGDQAIVRHRLAEPNCPFVQNPSNTCNVPLRPVSTNYPALGATSAEISQDNDTIENEALNSNQNEGQQTEYKTIMQRLQTFTNWPSSSIVSPEKLARAGFYYLQHDDYVQCAYCNGTLKRWETNDNPFEEHRKHFPDCDFYVHLDESDDLCLTNLKLLPGTMSSLSELGVQTHATPKKPDHLTYEGRLRTFNGWPENLKQTPEMLAMAGFYYDGSGDTVTCFHCDGGLRNWEATDDAWTEHARWFPKCEYVNLMRGQEFIQNCIQGRPPLDQSIFEGVAEDESIDIAEVPPTSPSSASPVTIQVQEAELEKLLQSPPAVILTAVSYYSFQAALEIGLHVDKVKKVLKKRIEEVGTPYTNADQLVEDVLSDQVTEELTSNGEGFNDDEKNENEVCSSKKEDSKTASNANCATVEKKGNVNVNETVSLEEENRRLKEARLCKICMDREVAIVFLPCGHLATCVYCAPSLTYCPMCRQEIRAIVRTFLS